jgi:hypothetical protein
MKVRPPVIYQDRLAMIIKYQFKDDRPLPPNKKIPILMSDLSDKDFRFTDSLFNRIFAPPIDIKLDLKYKFDLDMTRLNGKLKSLSPWITDHQGRVAIVILADGINYSINHGTKAMYKFYEDSVGISYLMHSNKELYFTYNLIQRIQLAAPLVHLESIQANEWFITMMNWNKSYADHNHMHSSVNSQINKLIAMGD